MANHDRVQLWKRLRPDKVPDALTAQQVCWCVGVWVGVRRRARPRACAKVPGAPTDPVVGECAPRNPAPTPKLYVEFGQSLPSVSTPIHLRIQRLLPRGTACSMRATHSPAYPQSRLTPVLFPVLPFSPFLLPRQLLHHHTLASSPSGRGIARSRGRRLERDQQGAQARRHVCSCIVRRPGAKAAGRPRLLA